MQAPLKSLLASHLLTLHWLQQVTDSSPRSVEQGRTTAQEGGGMGINIYWIILQSLTIIIPKNLCYGLNCVKCVKALVTQSCLTLCDPIGPITLWEIDGETVETVSEYYFGGLQNHCR